MVDLKINKEISKIYVYDYLIKKNQIFHSEIFVLNTWQTYLKFILDKQHSNI